jgi:Uma2 family endonuclease
MRWSDVLQDKTLRDLPYKIELNERGKIEMTPASNKHGYYESEIAYLLRSQLPEGKVITECSIETAKGVKVADVAWCSEEFLKRFGFTTPFVEAPEICVEIMSPSNSRAELEEKMQLYFDRGAKEVWIAFEDGNIEYYKQTGRILKSDFHVTVSLD